MAELSCMTLTKEKPSLLLGFHSHIPFDPKQNNTENESINNYLNLINLLTSFQNLKSTIHFSGNLISYLDKNFNDFSSKIRNLLEKNQLELFSGGRYEPIFPFIPKEDRQSQLLLMNRLLNHTYGYTPNGAWITDNAWESSLAIDLSKSRIQYTCLAKEYFTSTGLNENEISGYYLTEEEGRKIAVFPVLAKINDLIERYSPEEAIKTIINNAEQISSEKPSVVAFYEGPIENPEKLNWLKIFFQTLEKNTENIETKLFNDYFLHTKPNGRIYLPTAHDIKSQNTSTSSKYFLLKYPEANLLHKKMLRVSKKINAAKEGKSRFKVIKEMISQAQDLLLKGQVSHIYYDNTLGGLYSPCERHSIYSNLIMAENLIDASSRQGSKWIQASEIDYDCDGNDEIIIETETQNIYVSPGLGGTILEHDFRPKNINLINTLSREKEQNKYPKLNLIDHFLENDLDLTRCKSNTLPHLTKEITSSYHVDKIKAKEETCKITMNFKTNLIRLTGSPEIELQKQIGTRSGDSSLNIDYILTNKSTNAINFTFAVEFNLNIAPIYDPANYFYLEGNSKNKTQNPDLKSEEELNENNQISVHNQNIGIDLTLSWSNPCRLFRYPIETFLKNHEKPESILQGVTLLPTWPVNLEPNTSWELSIRQDINVRADEL